MANENIINVDISQDPIPEPKYGWCDYTNIATGEECKSKADMIITHSSKTKEYKIVERKCNYHFNVTRAEKNK